MSDKLIKSKKLNAIVSEVNMDPKEGILHNWNVAIKDNFNLIDTLTTASCGILQNHISIYTATAVKKLIDNGANIIAKTSMDELGMGGTNLTAFTGPVGNAYDSTRISGGSSGGSAVIVAVDEARVALGSDTGDSVRKPASYNGIVGFKPSYGRISRYGVIPYASSLDHVGFFTKNVEDAAVVLETLSGRDDLDMTSSFEPVLNYASLLDMDLNGKRIGYFKTLHDVVKEDKFTNDFDNLLKELEAKGAIIVEKTMDIKLLRAVLPTYSIISNAEAVANHANLDGVRYGVSYEGDTLESIMVQTRSNGFSTDIKRRFIFGAFSLNDKNQDEIFNQAKKVRRLIVNEYSKFFDDVDVVISMATSQIAPKIEGPFMEEDNDRYLVMENHMVINNFTGFPSITIPFTTVDEMPVGINLSAKAFNEAGLLAHAKQIETLINWKGAL